MLTLRYTDPSLVVLASADHDAAEAFAETLLPTSQVVSVERELRRIGDDPTEGALRRDAERALAGVISARLGHHRPTVVIASLSARERASMLSLAHAAKAPAHLLVLDTGSQSAALDTARVAAADGRALREGFASARAVYTDSVGAIEFGAGHLRDVDIIGDVHGCVRELRALLHQLGYVDLDGVPSHPDGRVAVFVGDLVDHGPDSVGAVMLADRMVSAGSGLIGALGNHDWRLYKRLIMKRKTADHGNLQDTLAQFAAAGQSATDALVRLFAHAPSHTLLDDGKLVVTHGAIRADLLGSRPVRDRDDEASELSLYGERYGGTDEQTGMLRRSHRWIADWPVDGPTVCFGHDVIGERPRVLGQHGKVVALDCGCADGGALAALRWPQRRATIAPSVTPRELTPDPIAV